MTSSVRLADVVLAWDVDPALELDPFLPLVADLPSTSDPPVLSVELRRATTRHAAPDPESDRVVMYHGASRCVLGTDHYTVLDGASRIDISSDGTSVIAHVHPDSLRVPDDFTFVALMMSLSLALRGHGRFHVHGAAVTLPDGVSVVIAGDSGRGKSTATLALLEHGAAWLGDDTFFVADDGADGVVLHAMPRPFHVSPRTLDAFSRLKPHVVSPLRPSGKFDVAAASAWPGRQIMTACPPAWLVFPEVAADLPTVAGCVDQATTLMEMMPATAWMVLDALPHHDEHVALVRRLVSSSRGIVVRMGTDMLVSPEILPRALRAAVSGAA